MLEEFAWLNEPPRWTCDSDGLEFATGDRTDFWQTTFYGFRRDSGHAFLRPVDGDFTLSAAFTGDFSELYDQAGLMLRFDAENWIKASIEFTDGLMHFSVVATRGHSDWSVVPLPDATPADEVRARLTRHGDAVRVQYSIGEKPWRLARLTPFSEGFAQAGVMACSPERAGFSARFRNIAVGPPIARDLHAD